MATVGIISVLRKLATFRLNEFVVRYLSGDSSLGSVTVKLSALIESSVTFVLLAVAYVAAGSISVVFLHDDGTTGVVRLYSLVLLGDIVTETCNGVQEAFGRFERQALASTVQYVTALLGVALVSILDGGLIYFALALVVAKTLNGVAVVGLAYRTANENMGAGWIRHGPVRLWDHFKSARSFLCHTNLSSTLSGVNKEADVVILSYFRPTSDVAFYKLGMTIVNAAFLPLAHLARTFYPALNRLLGDGNISDARNLIRGAVKVVGAWCLLAAILIVLVGKEFLRLVYGQEYLESFPIALVLLCGFSVAHVFFWVRPALLACGFESTTTNINALLVALKAGGVLLLVPQFGPVACAAILSANHILGNALGAARLRIVLSRQDSPVEA